MEFKAVKHAIFLWHVWDIPVSHFLVFAMRCKWVVTLALVLLILQLSSQTSRDIEYYSSMQNMKFLAEGEMSIVEKLRTYAAECESDINILKSVVESMKRNRTNDTAENIVHPVDNYLIIKSWARLENVVRRKRAKQGKAMVSEESYAGAATAVIRLLRTYDLNLTEVISGRINGFEAQTPLYSSDILDLAKTALKMHENYYASQLLQYLANQTQPLDSVELETAVNLTEQIRGISFDKDSQKQDWQISYERLCRSVDTISGTGYCHYRDTLVPVLKFKEEVLLDDPRIALIYDVLSDKEAEECIQYAQNKLIRSKVGGGLQYSDVRVSSFTAFPDSESLARKLSARVQLITGLRTLTLPTSGDTEAFSSDNLQILNYGIGGHYEPHTDYVIRQPHDSLNMYSEHERSIIKSGDRIATFFFYLTDVMAGGRTVFPNIDISIQPVKNAASFWFNSKMSGEYDIRTLHAGCPVLLGEKWGINKWIREYGNEFTRKCGQAEDYLSTTGL